tara:strand:- start:48 stop:443 length:396 start_codon:yes stop_codon:yes gene_type:complete
MTKYAAKIDISNIVKDIIILSDDVSDVETFCNNTFGGTWKETFKDGTRKQFAPIGGIYNSSKDKFICEQPFSSWTLDSNDDWQPPVVMPDVSDENYKDRRWNEEIQKWTALKVSEDVIYSWDASTSTWSQL